MCLSLQCFVYLTLDQIVIIWWAFSGSFGVKVAEMTTDRGFYGGIALQGQYETIMAETALLSLGGIAVASEKVEIDVIVLNCLNNVPIYRLLENLFIHRKKCHFQF
jgi:hypothetical protein